MTLFIAIVLFLIAVRVVVQMTLDSTNHAAWDTRTYALQKRPEAISAEHEEVVQRLVEFNQRFSARTPIAEQRRQMEALFGREVDAQISPVDAGGVPGEWVIAAGADPDHRLLYLHGGAFRLGSPKSHRGITNALSRRTGAAVLAIDYRMMPESKLIACHEDARTAYAWMLVHGADGAGDATSVAVAGDSAGGCLTLALAAFARDHGWRLPDALVVFAPGVDSTAASPTYKSNRATDPFLGPSLGIVARIPRLLLLVVMRLSSGSRPNDPEVSPLLGDLAGLPPTLIQASEQEMLFGEDLRYVNKAVAAGSPVRFQVWPKLVHVFQAFAPELPEAEEALDLAGLFIREHTRREPARPESRAS